MAVTITGLVIILVIVIVIAVIVYSLVQYIKEQARRVARTAFGTDDLLKGFQQMESDYAENPKSVTSMTSITLPRIVKDFPDFQYDEMKHKAENVLTGFLGAISERNVSRCPDANSELRQKISEKLNMLDDKGYKEHFDMVRIHRTEIKNYRKAAGKCIITFQSALESYHYITDSTGSVIKGKKDVKNQTRFNVDMIYIQDRDLVEGDGETALGFNCPNCGAPIKKLGVKVCEYCNTPVVEINIHAWSFSNVEEEL